MAEYFVTDWNNVYPLPDEISARTAIATLAPGLYLFLSWMDASLTVSQ